MKKNTKNNNQAIDAQELFLAMNDLEKETPFVAICGRKRSAGVRCREITSYNNNYGLRRGSQPRLFPSQSRSC